MQIQINKEFREYREKVYFGLSMRQLIFLFSEKRCVFEDENVNKI